MSREKDEYFEKIFRKATKGLEDHEFHHFNQSMGCMIYSKEHYKHEMKKRNMVPFEEADKLAQEWDKAHPHKSYDDISPRARDIISSLKLTADNHGNIQLGNKAIKALMEIGAIAPQSEHAPRDVIIQGGFS